MQPQHLLVDVPCVLPRPFKAQYLSMYSKACAEFLRDLITNIHNQLAVLYLLTLRSRRYQLMIIKWHNHIAKKAHMRQKQLLWLFLENEIFHSDVFYLYYYVLEWTNCTKIRVWAWGRRHMLKGWTDRRRVNSRDKRDIRKWFLGSLDTEGYVPFKEGDSHSSEIYILLKCKAHLMHMMGRWTDESVGIENVRIN